jgi:rare lipoprotein A
VNRLPPILSGLALAAALAGCTRAVPRPHYVLGPAYQAGGTWYYPAESYNAEQTGLATVVPAGHPALTADGERYSAGAMAAGHQTLQLPAIVEVTNLQNGRQVELRVNDRGPASPARLIELTPRAAALLGAGDGTPVRVRVLEMPSRAAAEALGGGPRLGLATAPVGAVQAASLAPPPGVRGSAGVAPAGSAPAATETQTAAVPLSLPERVTQTAPSPYLSLWIDAGRFTNAGPAERRRAVLAGLGASIRQLRVGRQIFYRVVIGPLGTVAQADAMLDRAMRAGVTDARIVVE